MLSERPSSKVASLASRGRRAPAGTGRCTTPPAASSRHAPLRAERLAETGHRAVDVLRLCLQAAPYHAGRRLVKVLRKAGLVRPRPSGGHGRCVLLRGAVWRRQYAIRCARVMRTLAQQNAQQHGPMACGMRPEALEVHARGREQRGTKPIFDSIDSHLVYISKQITDQSLQIRHVRAHAEAQSRSRGDRLAQP